MSWRPLALLLTVCALAGGMASRPQSLQDGRENAYRANNLGVALLEQFRYDEAASSFRQALELHPGLHIARLNLSIALLYDGQPDEALNAAQEAAAVLPALPHPHYVIGLAARAQGRVEDASAAFARTLKLDPSDAGALIHLGQIQLQQRRYDEAARMFDSALAAEAFNATAAYGLATSLTRSGRSEESARALERFEALRDAPYAITYSQAYLQQGRYGEAVASTGAEPELVDPSPPKVTFIDSTRELPPTQRPAEPGSGTPVSTGSVTLADFDGDGDLDAFATSRAGAGQRLYSNDAGTFADATARAGIAARGESAAIAAVPGDYDNDGRLDLLLLRQGGARLLRQSSGGTFEDVTEAAGIRSSPEAAVAAAFVDVDHDGDLDIFIAGGARSIAGEDRAAPNQLLRNNGTGTFVDITREAGLLDGAVRGVAVAPTDFDNRRDIDLVVIGPSSPPRLFKNMRDGSFHDVAAEVRLPAAARYSALAAADLDKDGFTDLFLGRSDAPGILAMSDGQGRFRQSDRLDVPAGVTVAQFVDYDNDGLLDLFTAAGRAVRLSRHLGRTWSDESGNTGLARLSAGLPAAIESVAFGDLDRDHDLDAVVLLENGELAYWRNQGGNSNRAIHVRLEGRVSNRSGIGSKVELRAGSLRQRVETAAVTPALGPHETMFGLGARRGADVVRVIWPSGTLQAETDLTDAMTVAEIDRKPSSCPYLYVWNGSRFEFVTDFLGGGEIGYWMSPGVWNSPDPDEYVRIPPGRLQPRGMRYELRVTNELEEALFVDHLQLLAIDHQQDVDVFPNEGLGAPRAGHLPPTTVRAVRPLRSATDDRGRNVLGRLTALDHDYVDGFQTLDIRGYAAPHALSFDIGPGGTDVVLLATGWTDYAFSSDNVAAHQRGLKLEPPVLEARTASGAWRHLASVGIPVGRPQTIVVDLAGKLRPRERELRIRTNMRIYWDQILVDRSGGGFATTVTRLDPIEANLRWRGFSAEVAPDSRQPPTYDYDRVTRMSLWKTMLGSYTREGDVRELLTKLDDMFVISRPGDEIALAFDAAALPPVAPGRRRTFLLLADGFSKEMDISSASPHTVGPLPFHGMRRYPYGADEGYPSTAAHIDYRTRYNTRIVSRAVPPVEVGAAGR
jgi:Flp pilus assembly protein TadD